MQRKRQVGIANRLRQNLKMVGTAKIAKINPMPMK